MEKEKQPNIQTHTEEVLNLLQQADSTKNLNPKKALEMVRRCIVQANDLRLITSIIKAFYIKAHCLSELGQLQKAIEILERTLHLLSHHSPEDLFTKSRAYNLLGNVYYKQEYRDIALNYYFKALELQIEGEQTKILNNISTVYYLNKDYTKALHYSELALIAAEREKKTFAAVAILLNSSSYLIRLENAPLASLKLEEAKKIYWQHKDEDDLIPPFWVNINIGEAEVLIFKEKAEAALKYIQRAFEGIEKYNQTKFLGHVYILEARTYILNGEDDKAIKAAIKAKDVGHQYQTEFHISKALELLIQIHSSRQEWNKALEYSEELRLKTEQLLQTTRNKNIKTILFHKKEEINNIVENQSDISEQYSLMEQLSHIISHDLKEPIRSIISFSSLLEKRYGNELGNEGKEFMKFISKGANTMNMNLIRLLEFTTLKELKLEKIRNINISNVISRIQTQYQETILPHQLHISYPQNIFIDMDEEHAYSIIDEVVSNAIKFRQETQNTFIKVTYTSDEENHFFSITDFGIGIEKDFQEVIFKIFYRLNKDIEGAGVGLAICERIIHLYGGKIRVESEKDKYYTLHFSIPKKITL